MKSSRLLFAMATAIILVFFGSSSIRAASKEKAPPAKGSIHVKGSANALERAALAKVSFQEALNAALKAVPGKMISGDLDAEEGVLKYEFDIVVDSKKVMEVSIDAGDAKVLEIEEGELD